MNAEHAPLLAIRDLAVSFPTDSGLVKAVDGMSLELERGQTLAIVGESGSGKSATFLGALGLLDSRDAIVTGEVLFDGVNLLGLTEKQLQSYRASRIGMIFQDSLTGLNPVHRIGSQVAEVERVHAHPPRWSPTARRQARSAARQDALAMLAGVGIPSVPQRAGQYPHQFSGGMRQRVMIAMALLLSPDLVIADEPTTALDVTVQAQILNLIADLQAKMGTAVVIITHDLGVVAQHSDHVLVMYAGKCVESAPCGRLFAEARHPYTQALMRSALRIDQPKLARLEVIEGQPPSLINLPPGCPFHVRCPSAMPICRTTAPPLRNAGTSHSYVCHLDTGGQPCAEVPSSARLGATIRQEPEVLPPVGGRGERSSVSAPVLALHSVVKDFPLHTSAVLPGRRAVVRAVDGVDLQLATGETLGLVGESGSGKSTLARIAARLHEPTAGKIEFDGRPVAGLNRSGSLAFHRDVQMVFQDPYASLNPRKTVGSIIAEPLRVHKTVPRGSLKGTVQELMEVVGLNPEHYSRFPYAFSGGQRQRVGIARALALRPKVIIADEPVSALDVSIQGQVLNLLSDLQQEFALTYLFIAHDLTVIRQISDRVSVMYLGRIVEDRRADDLFAAPAHPYTHALLAAAPLPDPAAVDREPIVLSGEVPSPTAIPAGCRFHTRCPRAQLPRCATEDPKLRPIPGGQVACHFPLTG